MSSIWWWRVEVVVVALPMLQVAAERVDSEPMSAGLC